MLRIALILAAAASATSLPASAATTVLTFNGAICGTTGNQACGNGSDIGQNYGDSALADVSYRTTDLTGATTANTLQYWSTNYGDLTDVVWGGSNGTGFRAEITFRPTAGFELSLLGFDSGCYLNRTSCQTLNYTVRSLGGTAIAAASADNTPGTFPSHATTAISSDYFSDGIVLTWGPDSYDVGLDNIAFDVRAIGEPPVSGAVPEPATWAMMIAGFGLVGSTVRRGRRGTRTNARLA